MLISSSQKQLIASESDQPSILSLFFSPVGGTLLGLTSLQREFFFNSLFRLLQLQGAENEQRVRQMSGKMLPPVSSSVMAVQRAAGREKTKEEAQLERAKARIARMENEQAQAMQGKGDASIQAQAESESPGGTGTAASFAGSIKQTAKPRKFSLPQKKQAKRIASGAQDSMGEPMLDSALRQAWEQDIEKQKALFLRKIVFKGRAGEVKSAQEGLAEMLNDYARGDAGKAQEVLSELASRMQQKEFESEDLGAVLLLVIEDQICAGIEGDVGSARPGGAASRVQSIVPEKIQKTAAASAEIRLASVREMLRYYFMRHPSELRGALASALDADEGGPDDLLQAKLSAALSEIGAFAVSQKVLAAIKEKKRLDTKKCLFELGYKYDKEKRKLILGKRTCGKPAEASGIVSLLLSKFKKPKK